MSRCPVPFAGVLAVALGFPPLASGMEAGGRLARALGSAHVRVESVEEHRFEDLDRDGVKEVLVQGRGNFAGSIPAGTLVVPLAEGNGLLAPGAGSGDFAGVFYFDRESFRWQPSLVAPVRGGAVAAFAPVALGSGASLVRLAHAEGGRVSERLFRSVPEGLEQVFHAVRGDGPGEGLWVHSDKLLVTRALPDPFAERAKGPGFLARTRYRWNGSGFVAESWALSGLGFKGDLEFSRKPRGDGPGGKAADARRKAWELQRAGDLGAADYRKTLVGMADHRLGAGAYQVAQEREGLAVVVPLGARDPRPRYLVQPFRRARGEAAVWVDLDEVGEASW